MSDLAAAISSGHVDRSIRELTDAVASGDTEAFGRLYRDWFDTMYADARRFSQRDEAFCLDVVHDAMLRVVRSMRQLPDEAALRRWLARIVRCCACDRLRSEVRRRGRELAREQYNGVADTGPDRARAQSDELDWLKRELARMDRESADLLEMRHRFGWTLQRIATALRQHPGALHGRLARIIRALRRRARETFDE